MLSKNEYLVPVRRADFELAISDPNAHSGFLSHSVDFLVKEGTEILAACDGEVFDVKVDSDEGGADEKYLGNKYLNFITIKHDGEEFSQYAHLRLKGACVNVGQKVLVGDVIGYSGNTGFSTMPHLHFHVCIDNDSEIGWETIEIKFSDKLKVIKGESDLNENDRILLKKILG
jgi:murein DD-endopeptidase MepM/ murein hydrolase activator NlpD